MIGRVPGSPHSPAKPSPKPGPKRRPEPGPGRTGSGRRALVSAGGEAAVGVHRRRAVAAALAVTVVAVVGGSRSARAAAPARTAAPERTRPRLPQPRPRARRAPWPPPSPACCPGSWRRRSAARWWLPGTAGPADRARRADAGGASASGVYAVLTAAACPADRSAQRPAARCRRGGRGRALVFGGGSPATVGTVQAFSRRWHCPRGGIDARAALRRPGGHDRRHRLHRGRLRRQPARRSVLATTDGRRFTVVAPLRVPVRYPAVAALGGQIYVFGGQAITGPTRGAGERHPGGRPGPAHGGRHRQPSRAAGGRRGGDSPGRCTWPAARAPPPSG